MLRSAMLAAVIAAAMAAGRDATEASPAPSPPRAAATPSATPAAPRYADVLIKDVPHVKQKPDFCGEACAEMFLKHLGSRIDQDGVFNVSGLDPSLGRGCWTRELATALERIGFKIGNVFTSIAGDKGTARTAAEVEAQWAAMHADLVRGTASIVCMYYDSEMRTPEHFRLVLGYDGRTDEVIYHEPAVAGAAYQRMKRDVFLKLWPLRGAGSMTVIRMRLEPGLKLREPAARAGFSPADFVQHVLALKEKLPATDFNVVVSAPFVVVGDQPAATVRMMAERTVKWAVDKLKADYFAKDPAEIIDVWLFKDKTSYDKYTREYFHDEPTTPYGYYSSVHKALIMNIATGGGTLVHEIVHPFMRTNFPACPDWFNEGMGSLYEQAEDRAGHISGRTNWRLDGLQKAIKAGGLPTFEALCGTTNSQFYNMDKGANYAQARYLCYYLQERGLLVKFYRDFVANQKTDPSGYKTLQKVLGETDMAAFQKRWEAYVMRLTFP